MTKTEQELEEFEKQLNLRTEELEKKEKKFKEGTAKFEKYIKNQISILEKKQTDSFTDPRRGKVTKITEPVSVFKK